MNALLVEFAVAASHPCLDGHFPGRPLVPGVVILDHVVALLESTHGRLPALRVPQAKFMQALLPGETARIELDGSAPRWRFRVWRGDTLLASGELATPA